MDTNAIPYHDAEGFPRTQERTFKSVSLPTHTPWGAPQQKEEIGPGLWHVSTAGHGGFWISTERRKAMPPSLRDAKTFAGGNWYEEDCDWSIVVAAFPGDFPPGTLEAALKTLKAWRKTVYASIYVNAIP